MGKQRSGLRDPSPKGLRALDGDLGVVSQEEDTGGRWDSGPAVAAWKMEVCSSLQLVAVGMGQPCVPLCQQLRAAWGDGDICPEPTAARLCIAPALSLGQGWGQGQGPGKGQPGPPVVPFSEGGAGFAKPGELSAAHVATVFSNEYRKG